MVKSPVTVRCIHRRFAWNLLTGVAIIALTAGCGRLGKKNKPPQRLTANYTNQARPPLKTNNPLFLATEHWAKQYKKKPSDPKVAINYAMNLKALGSKEKALTVLASSYRLNQGHSELASEYGRLALDLGKSRVAEPLLNQAMRSKRTADWRVLSALGTVNAKRGDHKKAQSYYLAALRQKPASASVFNNLALSYALDGKAGNAEGVLRNAVAKGHNTTRIRQNLAMVLGLQSKNAEAQMIAQANTGSQKKNKNSNGLLSAAKPKQLASATAKIPNNRARTDRITTASLPARKPFNKTQQVAASALQELKNPKASVKRIRKMAPGAKPVNLTSASKVSTKKPKEVLGAGLPWHKKPATPVKVRTANMHARQPKAKKDWNISIQEASPAKAMPVKTQVLKSERDDPFPSGN